MKKLLSGLMAGAVVISSASSLVACSKFTVISEIYLVTDSGKISDKSFNQSSYEAGNEFLQQVVAKVDPTYANSKIAKIEPENASTKILKNQYNNAKNNGAKTILLPGFHHANPGEGEYLAGQIMKDVEQGSSIMLDGANFSDNEIGFNFRGDISGFYAGMGSIIWSLQQKDVETDVSLGSFGGISNPQAVDNFIVGYLAAIDVFNKYKETEAGKSTLTKEVKDGGFGLDEKALNRTVKRTQDNLPLDTADSLWYTQSFAQGDAVNISKNLISLKSTVIMPVAGPQTLDVLGVSKTHDGGNTVKVIGVDTNQADAFPQHKGMFLTSAEKDLKNSTIAGLAHTKYWMEKYKNNLLEKLKEHLDDKITLTREVKNKDGEVSEYKSVDLDEPYSWEGQTLWVGGNMSSGGNNLLDEDTAKNIKSVFKPETLTDASIELFESIAAKNYGKTLINKDIIEAYVNTIINKGGFTYNG
ncbi:hypothetical protein [Spiroplasma endosymbiont of Diplazon laetatorius]|uniref:hypothetical protein n=1 Tax=Spiroplasma endosymbiont of Diplazon laetatorius TaxID=3066322 RepID=UPI0030CBBDAF